MYTSFRIYKYTTILDLYKRIRTCVIAHFLRLICEIKNARIITTAMNEAASKISVTVREETRRTALVEKCVRTIDHIKALVGGSF